MDINQGEIIEDKMIAIKRPGNGIPPVKLKSIIGRKATKNIALGTVMTVDMLDVS
jgi:sialic acid synthase SpsE